MNFTKNRIIEYVEKFEKELFKSEHIQFNFNKKWSSNFPDVAGIYAIYDLDKLVYVGETANLKERMKEVKRTYNHSFRKKLGKVLVEGSKIVKGKFGEKLELRLNDYYMERINFRYKEINFGRLEVESYLIHRHCENGLLNTPGKRNRID